MIAWQLVFKVVVTAIVVVAVAEIAKRSSLWGAVIALNSPLGACVS